MSETGICKACGEPSGPRTGPFCSRCDDDVSHLYQLWADVRSCGCGWPEDAFSLVRDLLALTPFYDHRPEIASRIGAGDPAADDGDLGAVQLVIGALDGAGFLDHGTSIWGSWITPKGRTFLSLAQRFAFRDMDHSGYPHDGHGCTPDCPYWHAVREEYEARDDGRAFDAAPAIPSARPECECARDREAQSSGVLVATLGWHGEVIDSYVLRLDCPWHGTQAVALGESVGRAFAAQPSGRVHPGSGS